MAAAWGFSMRDERDSSSPVNKKSSESTRQSVKIRNPNVEIAFGWNRMSLRIVGLWPHQTCKNSQASLIMRYFSPIMVIWVSSFIIVPQVLAPIAHTLALADLITVIENTVAFVGAVTRVLVLWYKSESTVVYNLKKIIVTRQSIEDCLKKVLGWCLSLITEDWTRKHTVEERKLMMKSARLSRSISIGVSIIAVIFLGSFLVVKSVSLFYMNFDTPNNTSFCRQLLVPSYIPFDVYKRSNFAFVWGGQFFSYVGASIAYSSADSFVAGLIVHLCGQITILRQALLKLVDHDTLMDSEIFRENLAVVVKRHNNIIQLAAVIKDAVNFMLLVWLLAYTIQLGLELFLLMTAVTNREPGQFPFAAVIFCIASLNVVLVHLLGSCYIGDMLIQESEALGMACYSSKWYNLSDKSAKDLMLVMQRARTPLKIWAGKFVPFSLELFSNVVKTSMGYFSLLLTMNERSLE